MAGDVAEFELRLKQSGARETAAAVSKIEESLRRTKRAADDFDPDKYWRQQLGSLNKVASAQDKIFNQARRQQERDAHGHSEGGLLGSAAKIGTIAGATEFGLEMAADAIREIASLGVEAVAEVAHLGLEFAEAADHAAVFADKSQLAISFLTHDAGGARQVFDDVRHEAQSLGLDVEETTHSFQRLLAMQFSVGQSKDLIKLGGDLQAVGADAEHVQRLLYTISEIKGMGTLQQRQVRMLEMAGVSGELINEALAKRLNVTTTAQVKKLQKKGQIDAATAIDAIEEAVMHKVGESKLGEAGAMFAKKSLSGQRGAMSAEIENFFVDIGENIGPTEERLQARVSELLSRALQNPAAGKFGEELLGDMGRVADWVDAHWPQITSEFDEGIDILVAGGEKLRAGADYIIDHWDQIKSTAQAAGEEIELAGDTIGAFVKPWMPFIEMSGKVVLAIDDIIHEIEKLDELTGGALHKMVALGAGAMIPGAGAVMASNMAAGARKDPLERQSDEERLDLEKNRAHTLELQQKYGLAPALAPRAPADANATAGGAQLAASKSVHVDNINVHVDAVDHGGHPEGAGEVVGNRTRAEILRMLEEG